MYIYIYIHIVLNPFPKNAQRPKAFRGETRREAKHAEIAVGIRSYEVLFEGASMAGKQAEQISLSFSVVRALSGTAMG